MAQTTIDAHPDVQATQLNTKDYIVIAGISKNYGAIQALKDISFSIKKGEVHTLLGENGAGKSTLVKMIKGEETPTTGEIYIDGNKIKQYTPTYAQSLGISMVHQELAVFENMTVAENIFPHCDFCTPIGSIDRRRLNAMAQKSIDVFNVAIKPTQKMDRLTLAQQQMVEIMRSISRGQQIILLDEPTSGLNNEEADKLMKIIHKLRADGITIIYISHRINEVMEISDRITIMRDGTYVCTYENNDTLSQDELVGKMVGHELSESLYMKKQYKDVSGNQTILSVENLAKKNALESVSFTLKSQEILGVFGLEGSGANTFSRMLYGLEGKDTGDIIYFGQPIKKLDPTTMVENKILYLNNNRKKAGLLLSSPAADNMSLPSLNKFSKFTIIDRGKLQQYAEKFIAMFSIVIPSIFTKPRSLSGGNQQKLMLSVCLGTSPKLIIINEPTRGIDVGAKAEIHKFILEIAKTGIGVIVFSSELPELLVLSDRVMVMNNKRHSGTVEKENLSEEAIMALAAGSHTGGDA